MIRKAQGMPLNTIVIAIIVLVVLVVLVAILIGRTGKFSEGTEKTEERAKSRICNAIGGHCEASALSCNPGEDYKPGDWIDCSEGEECCVGE